MPEHDEDCLCDACLNETISQMVEEGVFEWVGVNEDGEPMLRLPDGQ